MDNCKMYQVTHGFAPNKSSLIILMGHLSNTLAWMERISFGLLSEILIIRLAFWLTHWPQGQATPSDRRTGSLSFWYYSTTTSFEILNKRRPGVGHNSLAEAGDSSSVPGPRRRSPSPLGVDTAKNHVIASRVGVLVVLRLVWGACETSHSGLVPLFKPQREHIKNYLLWRWRLSGSVGPLDSQSNKRVIFFLYPTHTSHQVHITLATFNLHQLRCALQGTLYTWY